MARKKRNHSIKNLVNFFYEIGTLRTTPRTHQQALLESDPSDNIASHSFRVALIGWTLAKLEKADPYKVVTMCLTHDLSEARSGDQNWIHKRYVKAFEKEIKDAQTEALPKSWGLRQIISEYEERQTLEAKLAKDADLLDQILLLKEYSRKGNQEAQLWLSGKGRQAKKHKDMVFSRSARRLAVEAEKLNPGDWWLGIWTAKRR